MRGYTPSIGVLIAALKPGYLIEWESDGYSGARHFAIIIDVQKMGMSDAEYDSLIKILCSSKSYIFPGQIVAIHAVPSEDLRRFRAQDT